MYLLHSYNRTGWLQTAHNGSPLSLVFVANAQFKEDEYCAYLSISSDRAGLHGFMGFHEVSSPLLVAWGPSADLDCATIV